MEASLNISSKELAKPVSHRGNEAKSQFNRTNRTNMFLTVDKTESGTMTMNTAALTLKGRYDR